MLKLFRNKRAQSTAEYAIIIGVIIMAAMAMQTYVSRAIKGSIRYGVDKAGKEGGSGQYEPYYLESNYQTTQKGGWTDTEETLEGGGVSRVQGEKITERKGYQKTKEIPEN